MKKQLYVIIMFLFVLFLGLNINVVSLHAYTGETEENTEPKQREITVSDFASFQKAVNEALEGDKICLSRDINTSKQIIFNKDVNISVDFNNFLYRYTGNKEAFVIKKGIIHFSKTNVKSKNYSVSIQENGSLYIESGILCGYIKNKGYLNIDKGTFSNSGAKKSKTDELIQNYGILDIYGGKFTNTVDNCICSVEGEITIYGGDFYGKSPYNVKKKSDFPTILNAKKSKISIYGDVTVTGKSSAIFNDGVFIIDDGTYKSSNSNAIVNSTGSMIIRYAKISSNYSKGVPAIGNGGKISVYNSTINNALYNIGGSVTLGDVTMKCKYYCLLNESSGKIKISNGSYYSASHSVLLNYGGNVTMSGGWLQSKSKHNTIINDKGATFKMTKGNVVNTTGYAAIHNYGVIYLYGGSASSAGNHYYVINESGSVCKVKRSNIGYYNRIEWK